MLPVLYWNFKNDFISFTFHGDRIGFVSNKIDLLSFVRFNLGQVFYQNPITFIICFNAIISFFKKTKIQDNTGRSLIYLSIPLIAIFSLSSLFKPTLPHWSGPAFLPLIILSSFHLELKLSKGKRYVAAMLISLLSFFLIILVAGTLHIQYGIFGNGDSFTLVRKGKNDFTLDMYGWRQSEAKFMAFLEREKNENLSSENIALVSNRWFPAAHIDHYLAIPNKLTMIVAGDITRSHKYFWINQLRNNEVISKMYYLTDSRNYEDPSYLSARFGNIIPKDTIPITRNEMVVKYLFIYELHAP